MKYKPSEIRNQSMQYNISESRKLKLPAISLGLYYNFVGFDVFEKFYNPTRQQCGFDRQFELFER